MKALLLDLDDTLVTYGPGADTLWLHLARAAGAATLPDDQLLPALREAKRWMWHTPEQHRRTRVNARASWATVSRLAFQACGLALSDAAADHLAGHYLGQLITHLELLPGAREALVTWHRRGLPLALVTNGDGRVQREKLARHNLAGYFTALVFESEAGGGKPDAAIYRQALAQLGVAPADAWMAGDNLEFDVAGPQRVGRPDPGLGAWAGGTHGMSSRLRWWGPSASGQP